MRRQGRLSSEGLLLGGCSPPRGHLLERISWVDSWVWPLDLWSTEGNLDGNTVRPHPLIARTLGQRTRQCPAHASYRAAEDRTSHNNVAENNVAEPTAGTPLTGAVRRRHLSTRLHVLDAIVF